MNPNPGRIAVLTLVVAGLAGAALLTPILIPGHTDAATQPATWIPIPPDGMDARRGTIRELLDRLQPPYGDASTIAPRCGRDDLTGEPNEEYAIAIGDGELAPNAEHWEVNLVPQSDRMDVAIRIVSPYPPPPPPEPGKAPPPPSTEIQDRSARYSMDLTDMQPIHDALVNRDLWLAPQGEEPFGCTDGRPVTIEACVHGQYVARLRNCDFAEGAPAQKLLDALRRRFPKIANRQ